MRTCEKSLVCLIAFCLFSLGQVMNIHAAVPIYAAVHTGAAPGIWLVEDRNNDGDALDEGETTLFASVGGFTDVAVDGGGVLYAIDGETGKVYRIEDLNHDRDAEDPGEVVSFRDESALGLTLEGPLSIAVADYYDLDTLRTRARVYVMDLTLQLTVRMEDRDSDGDAQSSDEVCLIQESTTTAPFTAARMTVDEVGRIVACNPNLNWVVRLDDMNEDGHVADWEEKPCPSTNCGPAAPNEYRIIRLYVTGQLNLTYPFGVAISRDEEFFVSDLMEPEIRVVKLVDLNGDEDARDPGESSMYYGGASSRGFDIVVDEEDIVYIAEETYDGALVITRLEDRNGDGDAQDPGEDTLYARFTGIGVPLGLAAQMPPHPLLDIEPTLTDLSPKGDPILVVEDGTTATITLNVTYQSNGNPAPGVRVGGAALTGCFAVCPLSPRTDAGGNIQFYVTRTAEPPEEDGGEMLKFWVHGDKVFIPVVSTPCTPAPVANPGPNQKVSISETVTLDGSASTGEGLHYCWQQTAGPDVGLPECTEANAENPKVTFTAPSSPAILRFRLSVVNACGYRDDAEVTVRVVRSCPVKSVLPDEQATLEDLTRFRDEVLAGSPVGQEFIDGYYEHADELTDILLAHPKLGYQAARLTRSFMPDVRRLLDGRKVIITKTELKEATDFLGDLCNMASPELQVFLEWVQKQLSDETVLAQFGIRLAFAWRHR